MSVKKLKGENEMEITTIIAIEDIKVAFYVGKFSENYAALDPTISLYLPETDTEKIDTIAELLNAGDEATLLTYLRSL